MEETIGSEKHPQSVEVEWSDEDESSPGVCNFAILMYVFIHDKLL